MEGHRPSKPEIPGSNPGGPATLLLKELCDINIAASEDDADALCVALETG